VRTRWFCGERLSKWVRQNSTSLVTNVVIVTSFKNIYGSYLFFMFFWAEVFCSRSRRTSFRVLRFETCLDEEVKCTILLSDVGYLFRYYNDGRLLFFYRVKPTTAVIMCSYVFLFSSSVLWWFDLNGIVFLYYCLTTALSYAFVEHLDLYIVGFLRENKQKQKQMNIQFCLIDLETFSCLDQMKEWVCVLLLVDHSSVTSTCVLNTARDHCPDNGPTHVWHYILFPM
jgi:hypothetical protein